MILTATAPALRSHALTGCAAHETCALPKVPTCPDCAPLLHGGPLVALEDGICPQCTYRDAHQPWPCDACGGVVYRTETQRFVRWWCTCGAVHAEDVK